MAPRPSLRSLKASQASSRTARDALGLSQMDSRLRVGSSPGSEARARSANTLAGAMRVSPSRMRAASCSATGLSTAAVSVTSSCSVWKRTSVAACVPSSWRRTLPSRASSVVMAPATSATSSPPGTGSAPLRSRSEA